MDWFITFVNPGKPIPEEVARLTDIHDSDVAEAPSPEEALAALVSFVGDASVVAHNVDFDRTFTTRHPSGYPLLENTWIDSLDLARIALPRLKSHRLLDLVRAFGAPLSNSSRRCGRGGHLRDVSHPSCWRGGYASCACEGNLLEWQPLTSGLRRLCSIVLPIFNRAQRTARSFQPLERCFT